VGYEVEGGQGHDIRRDLARAIVTSGWGLLEMRPLRLSLEEIFLSLTTEESSSAPAGDAAQAEGEGAAVTDAEGDRA
jgi:ABC-2 type transport system ATP-binding protein